MGDTASGSWGSRELLGHVRQEEARMEQEKGHMNGWQYKLYLPKGSADGIWQVLNSEHIIANVDPCDTYSDDAEDMARLISAAPEMLKALRAIESCLAPEDNDRAARLVRDAIRKATGGNDGI